MGSAAFPHRAQTAQRNSQCPAEKQQRANKQNAQHSTGPRTDEGKQRSSQNALKHGLRSKHPVIPGEDPAEYQRKLDKLRADLRPLNALEEDLVEQIADASWRLKRFSRIEAAVNAYHLDRCANQEHNTGKDDEHILGNTFTGFALTDLTRLSRYETQLTRRYHRAIKELRDLRKGAEDNWFVARLPDNRTRAERDRDEQEYQKQELTRRDPTRQPADRTNPVHATTNETSNFGHIGHSQAHPQPGPISTNSRNLRPSRPQRGHQIIATPCQNPPRSDTHYHRTPDLRPAASTHARSNRGAGVNLRAREQNKRKSSTSSIPPNQNSEPRP